MKFRVFIVFVFLACCLLPSINLAQNKVVVIPLIDDGITCSGTLVGTRWCDNGNQTVTDMTTGLVWLKFAGWGGQKGWHSFSPGDPDGAHQRAGLLHDGELLHIGIGDYRFYLNDGSVVGDWRLPTKTELSILVNGLEAVSSTNMRAFRGVQSAYYWSSTTYANDPTYAWSVSLNAGTVATNLKTHNGLYVWPVRSGN